jgi:hypothetical protein
MVSCTGPGTLAREKSVILEHRKQAVSDEIEAAVRVTTPGHLAQTDVGSGVDDWPMLPAMLDGSGSPTEVDERQMQPALEVMDAELERATCARPTTRRVASRPQGKTHCEDEAHRARSGSEPLRWHRATEALMRPVLVVRGDVSGKLSLEAREAHRHQDLEETLLLERAKEALDDGDGCRAPRSCRSAAERSFACARRGTRAETASPDR